ncbi:MGST1-like protein [Mya arenaria]|uniref:Microsomal glutathione S-transferase 1 n=1 Tax=Mya arenaria TaxID=6604 RepID=A0ABY7DRL6_MYAAR|nr:microsomal glutathione S-transferase 1-like isoform X1 [Mya arenaria]WAQ99362.1 MGST1-like protein [Mya arenaria]
MAVEISVENGLFRTYAFYACFLLIKILSNNVITVYYRTIRKSYRVPEDYVMANAKDTGGSTHPDVERAVRIHVHDIENIVPFILIGFFYVLTGPTVALATWYFRLFTCARLLHTASYLLKLQPYRTIGHVLATVINVLMATSTLCSLF